MAITRTLIEQATTYSSYIEEVKSLHEAGRTTNDDNQESMLEYTRVNMHRMRKWDKTFQPNETIAAKLNPLPEKWIWLVITEGWCGDAAQNIPALAQLADLSPNVSFKLIYRDQYPEVMDQYLTNGSRSIPKLVCLREEDLEELGTWGPRPKPAQERVLELKADPNFDKSKLAEEIHLWYAKDKGQAIQKEFEGLIETWSEKSKKLATVS